MPTDRDKISRKTTLLTVVFTPLSCYAKLLIWVAGKPGRRLEQVPDVYQ